MSANIDIDPCVLNIDKYLSAKADFKIQFKSSKNWQTEFLHPPEKFTKLAYKSRMII